MERSPAYIHSSSLRKPSNTTIVHHQFLYLQGFEYLWASKAFCWRKEIRGFFNRCWFPGDMEAPR